MFVFHRPKRKYHSIRDRLHTKMIFGYARWQQWWITDRIKCFGGLDSTEPSTSNESRPSKMWKTNSVCVCKREKEREKQRNRRILKWNTVNYVLCEIITGAIVCKRISGCISFPLPSTSKVSSWLYIFAWNIIATTMVIICLCHFLEFCSGPLAVCCVSSSSDSPIIRSLSFSSK